jgi:hypothetical protein
VTRTRATKISNTLFFKHQYIANPAISPDSHVVAAAQQLVTALKGNIPAGNEMAEALTRVSKLLGHQSKGAEKKTPGKPLSMNHYSPGGQSPSG